MDPFFQVKSRFHNGIKNVTDGQIVKLCFSLKPISGSSFVEAVTGFHDKTPNSGYSAYIQWMHLVNFFSGGSLWD